MSEVMRRDDGPLDPVVILAAGRSSRMGQPKALLEVEGRPFLTWQVERLRVAGATRIVLVTAPDPEPCGVLVGPLGLDRVVNPRPELGPFSSLQVGLTEALRVPGPGVFVLPLDVPAPAPETWLVLARAGADASAAVPTTPAGRGGHPVWLSRACAEGLLSLDIGAEHARLDRQLRALGSGLRRLRVPDPAIALDLDTPAEWQAWLGTRGSA